MKAFSRSFLAATGLVVAAAATSPASAKITQYECRFPQEMGRGGGWIPEMLILTDDDVEGEIVVFDPIIKQYIGNPIKAELLVRTNVRSTYKWEVKMENRGKHTRMAYTLSYRSNGQPATISARPGGYDNSFSGEGTCKVSKG